MKVRHYPGLPAPAPLRRWAAALLCGTLLAVAGCGGSKPQAHRTAPPAQRDWPVVQADDPAAATSVLMLHKRYGNQPGAMRLPGGPLIPVVALLLSIGLLASAKLENLVAGAIALLIGAVIYRFRRKPVATAG